MNEFKTETKLFENGAGEVREKRLTGERALFMARNLRVADCIFADGESPLKESRNISVENSSFQWKYPLWYCSDISVKNSTFFDMARAGIWYTKNISLTDCLYEAPKGFRRVTGLTLKKVDIPNASETLWNCTNVEAENIVVKGDYFAMNCTDIKINGMNLVGNYVFDGCRNVEVSDSKLIAKDAFWNCENVTVKGSYVSGEYAGWNSKNVTFINCTLESLQGFCYMENVTLINCKVLNTTLAFEYSTVNVEATTRIESIKNPISGTIRCKEIGELIFDDRAIDCKATKIECTDGIEKCVCEEKSA